MRIYLVYLVVFCGCLLAFKYPFISILLWIWYSLFSPQLSAYGDITDLNKIIAGVSIIGLSYSREIRDFRPNTIFMLLILFMLIIINSQIFSLSPPDSYATYEQVLKSILLALLIIIYTNNQARFMSIIWLLCGVYAVFATRGLVSTIRNGGSGLTVGAPFTISFDRNHFAVICATLIPMYFFLSEVSKNKFAKIGSYMVAIFAAISIIGGNSRGGFITLCFCGILLFFRSKNKIIFIVISSFFIAGLFAYAPSSWWSRILTIEDARKNDESFKGRLVAWENNVELAKAFPMSGAGLRISYNYRLIHNYINNTETRAAHSAYYEILGSTGFLGLGVFILLLSFPALHAFISYYSGIKRKIAPWGRRFLFYLPVSLAIFALGASSISIELWEGYLILIALAGSLKRAAMLPEYKKEIKNRSMLKSISLGKKQLNT